MRAQGSRVSQSFDGRYLATKLYRFFISESGDVNEAFVNRIANIYRQRHSNMKEVVRESLEQLTKRITPVLTVSKNGSGK